MEISEASSIVTIDASSNEFNGQIPPSIGNMKSLSSLNLDDNQFSGTIPNTIGSCSALNSINLAGNSLSGPIPSTIGSLPNLNTLNLSSNRLSGEIPASLSSLKLTLLDLSNNSALCGHTIGYLLQCPSSMNHHKLRVALITIFLITLLLIFLIFLTRYILLSTKRKSVRLASDSWSMKSFGVFHFNENEIISSIRQENLIGKGGTGEVYRVRLNNNHVVAVKHIMHLKRHSLKQFDSEVSTLSTIRHVNVVKLYCSISGEDSSLLVYEYLANGSLWDWLHYAGACEKFGKLDWATRFDIAVGAAQWRN